MTPSSSKPLVLLRRKQVEARTGLGRTTIYNRMKAGSFPRAVNIGLRAVAWYEGDIEAWIERQIAESRKVDGAPKGTKHAA